MRIIVAIIIIFSFISVGMAKDNLCRVSGEPVGFAVVSSTKGYTPLLNDKKQIIKKLSNGQ